MRDELPETHHQAVDERENQVYRSASQQAPDSRRRVQYERRAGRRGRRRGWRGGELVVAVVVLAVRGDGHGRVGERLRVRG